MRKLVRRGASLGVSVVFFGLGVPMHAGDSPPVKKQDVKVYSPDRRFYAVSLLKQGRTSIFHAGSAKPTWEIPGYASVLYLSDDGKHLVEGYEGGNLFSVNTQGSDPFLTFFAGPDHSTKLTVEQVFPHWRDLTRTTSGWAWGSFWGFEKPTRFVIRLDSGKKIAFDADTGKQLPS